ncbi:MAG: sialate O-acetylesterase [Reinekea sp.]
MKKTKTKILCSIGTVLFTLSGFTYAEPDPNFHIYLMVGQSNMEGAATIEEQDKVINPRVKVLQDESCSMLNASYGQWRTAYPPLNRCVSYLGLGPGDMFGKVMADNSDPEVTIGLVGAAHGGQSIKYFLKNCADYSACTPSFGVTPNNLVGGYAWLLDLAKRAQEKGVIKGIIFHQGETDTGNPNWPGWVKQMVTDLRNDLGTGDIPFVAGELPLTGCCVSHNPQVHQLPSVISNAHYVTAEGLTLHDQFHWDSASVRTMGRRYANKMLTLVDTSASGNDNGSGSGNTGENEITVRMLGTNGDERVKLQVGGVDIAMWTTTTGMADYRVATDMTGDIRVAFVNDAPGRDVLVDYITVNGEVRQAEDQNDNTGAWGNSTCGGGTYSEWLHCNGSIGFGPVSDSSKDPGTDNPDSTTNVDAYIDITDDWGNGYCGNLVVTNNSGATVTWEAAVTVDGIVTRLWNGNWSQSNTALTITGTDWNAKLAAGATDTSVGLCITRLPFFR